MGKVIDLRTKTECDPETGALKNGLPVFKGDIHYEESAVDMDFANFIVQVAYQLPERSKRSMVAGLEKIDELCVFAQMTRNETLLQMLCNLGFLSIVQKEGME